MWHYIYLFIYREGGKREREREREKERRRKKRKGKNDKESYFSARAMTGETIDMLNKLSLDDVDGWHLDSAGGSQVQFNTIENSSFTIDLFSVHIIHLLIALHLGNI